VIYVENHINLRTWLTIDESNKEKVLELALELKRIGAMNDDNFDTIEDVTKYFELSY
jgi:hypothetical protein